MQEEANVLYMVKKKTRPFYLAKWQQIDRDKAKYQELNEKLYRSIRSLVFGAQSFFAVVFFKR